VITNKGNGKERRPAPQKQPWEQKGHHKPAGIATAGCIARDSRPDLEPTRTRTQPGSASASAFAFAFAFAFALAFAFAFAFDRCAVLLSCY
jgi:hypothetical protein